MDLPFSPTFSTRKVWAGAAVISQVIDSKFYSCFVEKHFFSKRWNWVTVGHNIKHVLLQWFAASSAWIIHPPLGRFDSGDLVPSDRWNYQFLEIHDPATNFRWTKWSTKNGVTNGRSLRKIEEPSYKKLLEHRHHGFIFPEYWECARMAVLNWIVEHTLL